MQVLVPLVCTVSFFLRRDLYASSITLLWTAQSLLNVSVYIRDARTRNLPLLTDDPDTHDWWNILWTTGHLKQDQALAGAVVFCAILLYGLALYLGFRGLSVQAPENSG